VFFKMVSIQFVGKTCFEKCRKIVFLDIFSRNCPCRSTWIFEDVIYLPCRKNEFTRKVKKSNFGHFYNSRLESKNVGKMCFFRSL
jgi:hypothetical protein